MLVVSATLAGCSTPPGPDPAKPAPRLPVDAIAFDDLKSTNRQFPFTRTCAQIDQKVLDEIKARKARVLSTMGVNGGCAITMGSPTLEEIWIQPMDPPNPSEPRYFPLLWNGVKSQTYLRRLMLDERYYAVEVIDFYGGQPGCFLTVDTGSPTALEFRGILPKKLAATIPQLNSSMTNYQVDHAGIERFMTANCPEVEKLAVTLMGAIDPAGGSLAT